jgi:hypothetical protein
MSYKEREMKTRDPIADALPRKRSHRILPYRDRVIVRSLVESGVSTHKVGKLVGIPQSTVMAIKQDPDLTPDRIVQMKDILPGRYYKLAHAALDSVTVEKLQNVDPYRGTLISKIAADAARMCEGLPSQTVLVKKVAVHLQGDLKSLRERKEKLLRSLGGTVVDSQVA